jgi:hypothetical protein
MDAAAVIGELAASAGLVQAGTRLSAAELLQALDPQFFAERLRAAAALQS